MVEAEKQTIARQEQVESDLKGQFPQVDLLVASTKGLKLALEEAMMGVFAGSKVFIVGAVNDL